MKNLFLRTALGIVGLAIIATVSFAQKYLPDTARIAFVNSDRSVIMAKRLGAPNVDTLIKSAGKATLSHLAVLASKRDGSALLIAGTVEFPPPWAPTTKLKVDVIIRAEAPFTFTGAATEVQFNPNPFKITALGSFKVLQVFGKGEALIKLPLGTISSDENEWYATWTKSGSAGIPVWFYHGKFDLSDSKVDSFKVDWIGTSQFHMDNLMVTSDNRSLFFIGAHGLESASGLTIRSQQWTPRPGQGETEIYTSTELKGSIQNKLPASTFNIDTAFAFLLKPLPGMKSKFSLITTKNRDINNLLLDVGGASLTNQNDIIPGNIIPDSLRMFTGFTGTPGDPNDGKEVQTTQCSPGGLGNGGDIMYDFTGDSIVFVTCGITQDGNFEADNVHSQIWVYKMGAAKATLVHNDPNAMERQPIFMGRSPRLAPEPPYVPGKGELVQTSLDFGTIKVNKNSTKTVAVKSITSGKIIVSKVELDPNSAPYSVTAPSPVPFNIAGGASASFSVKFAPTAVGSFPATFKITYHDSLNADGVHDSLLTVSLTGTAEQDGAVRPEAEKYFSMTLVPNPLKNSAEVEVTATENGAVSIEIVNEAGASLYKSASKYLASGEQTTFAFKASELGLSEGTYYVLLHTPQGDVMRKAVVIK